MPTDTSPHPDHLFCGALRLWATFHLPSSPQGRGRQRGRSRPQAAPIRNALPLPPLFLPVESTMKSFVVLFPRSLCVLTDPRGPSRHGVAPLPLRTVTNNLCLQCRSSPDLLVLPRLHNKKTYILKHGYKATIHLPTIFWLLKGWS